MESDDDIAYAENGSHRAIARQKSTKTTHNAVLPIRRKRTSSESESPPLNAELQLGRTMPVHAVDNQNTAAVDSTGFNLSSYVPKASRKYPVVTPVSHAAIRTKGASVRGDIMFSVDDDVDTPGPDGGPSDYTYAQMNELLQTADSTLSGTQMRSVGPLSSTPISPAARGPELDRPAHWKRKPDSTGARAGRAGVKRALSPPRKKGTVAPRGRAHHQPDPRSTSIRRSTVDAATLLSNGFGLSWMSQSASTASTGRGAGAGAGAGRRSSGPVDDIQEAELPRATATPASTAFVDDASIPAGPDDCISVASPPFSRHAPDGGLSMDYAPALGSASKSRGTSSSALSVRFQNACKRAVRDETRLGALVGAGAGAGTAMMDPRRKFRMCVELEVLRDTRMAGGVFIEARCAVTDVRMHQSRAAPRTAPVIAAEGTPSEDMPPFVLTVAEGGSPITRADDIVASAMSPAATPSANNRFDLSQDFRDVSCVAYFKLDTNRDKLFSAGSRCRVYDPVVLSNLGDFPPPVESVTGDESLPDSAKRIVLICTYLMEMV